MNQDHALGTMITTAGAANVCCVIFFVPSFLKTLIVFWGPLQTG